jgi:glycosyltransferase involved in cell wall biosynthesis
MVDAIVVVNEAQAETARKLLGVATQRLFVIPNIVDAQYFAPTPDTHADGGYVLCTGNICARKNQLRLAEAACLAGCPLVIIGDVLVGEERYGDELRRICEQEANLRWHRRMQPDSAALVTAYRRARVFALPSLDETQPLSLLEAAAARRALVISDLPYSRDHAYRNARLVQPRSVRSICEGLRAAMAAPQRYTPPQEALQSFTQERVAAAYCEIFARLVPQMQAHGR